MCNFKPRLGRQMRLGRGKHGMRPGTCEPKWPRGHPPGPPGTRRAPHVITVMSDVRRDAPPFSFQAAAEALRDLPSTGEGPTHLERGAYAPLVEDAPRVASSVEDSDSVSAA